MKVSSEQIAETKLGASVLELCNSFCLLIASVLKPVREPAPLQRGGWVSLIFHTFALDERCSNVCFTSLL